MKTIGEKLKLMRMKMGITQGEVASSIGVERSTYTYYELGRIKPDLDTMKKLANIFGVKLYALLDEDFEQVFNDQPIIHRRMHIGDLNDDEKRLILIFRTLPREKREEIFKNFESFEKTKAEN